MLEYRGYDAVGLAIIKGAGGKIKVVKAKGRLKELAEKANDDKALKGTVGYRSYTLGNTW